MLAARDHLIHRYCYDLPSFYAGENEKLYSLGVNGYKSIHYKAAATTNGPGSTVVHEHVGFVHHPRLLLLLPRLLGRSVVQQGEGERKYDIPGVIFSDVENRRYATNSCIRFVSAWFLRWLLCLHRRSGGIFIAGGRWYNFQVGDHMSAAVV